MIYRSVAIQLLVVLLATTGLSAQGLILSGVKGGSYNLLANDLNKISTTKFKVLGSGGSIENFNKLIAPNDTSLAFMQFDVLLYQKEVVKAQYIEDIEILLPLATEEVHLITLVDYDISSIKDLAGKRIAIGSTKQGTNVTARMIQQRTRVKWESVELGFEDSFAALLSGQVHAFFYVGAAPAGKLNELTARSAKLLKLVPIRHKRLKRVYANALIKAGTYPWVNNDVLTVSVQSVLAVNVSSETDNDTHVLEVFLNDIKQGAIRLQKNGHPKWKEIDFSFRNIDWPKHSAARKVF